jgi:hypothetical protein
MHFPGAAGYIVFNMIMRDNAVSKDHQPRQKDRKSFYFYPFPQTFKFCTNVVTLLVQQEIIRLKVHKVKAICG